MPLVHSAGRLVRPQVSAGLRNPAPSLACAEREPFSPEGHLSGQPSQERKPRVFLHNQSGKRQDSLAPVSFSVCLRACQDIVCNSLVSLQCVLVPR